MFYIFTLDSHDCFGPFDTKSAALNWAKRLPSYQLLNKIPYLSTLILKPFLV